MSVTNFYKENVKKAIESGIDLIISGAGLPKELPKLIQGTNVKIAPIISSARGADLMIKLWAKQNHIPDMIVVEGPEAGGHLGFSKEELKEENKKNIYEIVREVVDKVKEFEEEFKKKIPVIAAGGIYNGKDIISALKAGASGVQMATRFVATEECDADIKYKEAYIKATKEEIEIVQSPVGMPGRAIRNKFIEEVEERKEKGIKGINSKCLGCIKTCNPKETPYCITRALINAVKGDIDNSLLFVRK
jgi:NAD(P)H-dependent flavin oxidoreductase YrpB (nitropropane dioxygenase family)